MDMAICQLIIMWLFWCKNLQIPGDKILGLAKFFLGMGVPGSSKDLFNQIDSLSLLENNRQELAIEVLCSTQFMFLNSHFLDSWLPELYNEFRLILYNNNFCILHLWVIYLFSKIPHLKEYETTFIWLSWFIFDVQLIFFCRVSIPLILSLPSTVLSLSSKDQLKVCDWFVFLF